MAMNDTIAAALSKINNAEIATKDTVQIRPFSKILLKILDIANELGYIGKYEIIQDPKGGLLVVNLINKINKCGVVKPRYSVSYKDFEKFEKRYLLSKDFGVLFVSTTKGIMTHKEAKRQQLGGVLIAYMY